ncbi:hypothetical protein T484DRAFT_1855505 [Baffinella frigidus]|nr:hypothetical protein T484DRAFT_1860307 [Cryptophyta sp. CCMP2293]KAJ1468374.1 hypothetical protein T484DRAFT_1855505 [Cryptophyta sp. CCMP2293]
MDFVASFLNIPPNPRRTTSEGSTGSSSSTVSRLSSLVPAFLHRPLLTRRQAPAEAGPSAGKCTLRSSSSPPLTTRKLWRTNASGFVDREDLTRVAKNTGIDARSQSSYTKCELWSLSLKDDCDIRVLSKTTSASSPFSSEDDTLTPSAPHPDDPKTFDVFATTRDTLGYHRSSSAPPAMPRKLSRLGLDDECDLPQRIFQGEFL